jgi:hypothetical protein
MNDRWKIIAGLLAVLILAAFPVWYGWGQKTSAPDLRLDTPEIEKLKDKRCVESTAVMREKHMKLLKEWREAVVRDGNRIYTSGDGRTFEMSLSGNCLACHSNKAQFCDRCHDYAGVKPNCWSCHIIPGDVR